MATEATGPESAHRIGETMVLLQEPQGPLLRPASLQGPAAAIGFGVSGLGRHARGAHGKTRRPFTSAPGVPFLGLLQQEPSHP